MGGGGEGLSEIKKRQRENDMWISLVVIGIEKRCRIDGCRRM